MKVQEVEEFKVSRVLLTLLFVYVAMSLIKAGKAEGAMYRDRMVALVIFMVINVIFWACFEQAGTSLTLFAALIIGTDS